MMQTEEEQRLNNYRDELVNLLDKSNAEFNKQLAYVSSGGIGFTILLLNTLFQDLSVVHCKVFLIFSWAGFTLCLLMNLISPLISFRFHYKTIEEIDNGMYQYNDALKRNKRIRCLRLVSVYILLAGILAFMLFLICNL